MISESRLVMVGEVAVGGNNPIVVQSMTNTNTLDTNKTVEQIKNLHSVGCEIVRLTTRNVQEAENLKNIKSELQKLNINIPLIADVHFNPAVAEVAAAIVEKVRINPGNYADKRSGKTAFSQDEDQKEIQNISLRLKPLLEICKQYNTAIRIGINHGSLSERICFKYGNTARGMLESAMEFVEICRSHDFHNIVLSMKASFVPTGVEARIKSAAGIGSLLAEGIGDTIRVSLTEKPENEIPFAKLLVEEFGKRKILDLPKTVKVKGDFNGVSLEYENLKSEELFLKSSVDFTRLYLKNSIKHLKIKNDGVEQNALSDNILQALGIKYSKAEFIACPSCGRTLFDIEEEFERVKKATSHLKGIKIAVMGCIVNGLGEMADADYGYVGAARGKVNIYKGRKLIKKDIALGESLEQLVTLIKESGDWK